MIGARRFDSALRLVPSPFQARTAWEGLSFPRLMAVIPALSLGDWEGSARWLASAGTGLKPSRAPISACKPDESPRQHDDNAYPSYGDDDAKQ
jgi:hypothetical protein